MTQINKSFKEIINIYDFVNTKDAEFKDLYLDAKVYKGLDLLLQRHDKESLLNMLNENDIQDVETFLSIAHDVNYFLGNDYCYYTSIFDLDSENLNAIKDIILSRQLNFKVSNSDTNINYTFYSQLAHSLIYTANTGLTDGSKLFNIMKEVRETCNGDYSTLRMGGTQDFYSILLTDKHITKKRYSFYLYTGTSTNILLVAYL